MPGLSFFNARYVHEAYAFRVLPVKYGREIRREARASFDTAARLTTAIMTA